ncbi:hypothetical protein [Gemmatimonas phototrophica]|uniref:DUF4197 domain-containing protein n=1 Tax=Gemmatimonas phototrophica TaxID=1379270 RepID=A0A143BMP2_9BACT|nr:hypothetical protein [Gemmatimonas phototrophica]AMW06379.1 hypothetical protein GEMMAAP_19485 [Gemmatimonas phototrophica]
MSLRIAALLLVLFTAPSLLHAQDASPFDAIADESARASLRTIIADAAARGLPTAPLVTKVREGLAKRATPDRIRSATALLADRLAVASKAIAPTKSAEELTAAADALQAGIPTATLRDMRQLWPQRPLTVPLGVLAEMVASGVSRSVATRRVRELLVKGANTTQFASLGSTVSSDIAAGLAPDAAMELRSKGVLSLIESNSRAGLTTTGAPIRPPVKR